MRQLPATRRLPAIWRFPAIWRRDVPLGLLQIMAVVVAVYSVNAAQLTVLNIAGAPGGWHVARTAPVVLAGVLACSAVLFALAGAIVRRRLLMLRLVVVAGLGASLTAAAAAAAAGRVATRDGVPWIGQLVFVAMVAAVVCLRPAAATAYGVVVVAAAAVSDVSPADNLLLWVAFGATVAVHGYLLQSAISFTAEVEAAHHRAATAAIRQARASSERAARQAWDAWIHDTLLAVLHLGALRNPAAAVQARELLQTGLRRAGPPPGGLRQSVESAVVGLPVRVEWDVHVDGDPPSHVLDATTRALGEAVRNAGRHSGAGSVLVAGEITTSRLRLTVTDGGCGFEPQQMPDHCLGIRASIITRMSDVGGRAAIASAPGRGTQATVSWGEQTPPHDPQRWASWRWLLSLGATAVTASAIGSVTDQGHQALLWALSGLVCLGACVAVVLLRPALAWLAWLGWLLAETALCLAQPVVDGLGNGTWYVVGSGLLLGVSAFRRREGTGLRFSVAAFGVQLVALALWRPGRLPILVIPLAQQVIYAAASWFLVRSHERMFLRLRQAWDRSVEIERALALQQADADEEQRRLADLSALVVPLLQDLAAAESISQPLAGHCAVAEAGLRDRLAAPALLTAHTQQTLVHLRRNGVYVSLTDDGADTDAAEAARVCSVFTVLASTAQPGSRVTVRWTRLDRRCFATATVTRPRPAALPGLDVAIADAEVRWDDDAVQVRLLRRGRCEAANG
jgi:signal transduction histidine kinase